MFFFCAPPADAGTLLDNQDRGVAPAREKTRPVRQHWRPIRLLPISQRPCQIGQAHLALHDHFSLA